MEALCQRLTRERPYARVERDVSYGGNCERLLRDRSGMTGAAIPMRWPLYKPQLRISRPERPLGLVEAISYPAD